ncbi:MAG: dipeptide epimerase [Candidatus Glassbacteria bacterium]|nr:dipeptide epimerase [Candidatus Glassbacteria bacterium]
MKISWEPISLTTKHTFKIAREELTGDRFDNVIVRLEHEGIVGWGEAAPFFIYGDNQRTVIAALETWQPFIERWEDPWQSEKMMAELDGVLEGNFAAKSAVDCALYDLQGKLAELPVYRMLGLSPDAVPVSSFTIGIDTPEVVREKVREAKNCPVLKVKVGGPQDMDVLEVVRREAPEAVIRVDANCGWEPHHALRMIHQLAEEGVEFVEQPLPAADIESQRWLYEKSPLPLMADESCERLEDIQNCVGRFDMINIKLSKCGGLRHALKMIGAARAHGMEIMLGCMLESSIQITAAAQISPLVDYADLDGAELLANDPFTGVEFNNGKLVLPHGPGLGVERK